MSIASEITRLQNIKTNIRNALVAQGITAASTHNMADFAADISNISSAGATITVTYDSAFYNKTMTCTKGTKTYTKTTTSSGSTTFNVSEEGTWTITCNGVSATVAVVLSYSTQMKPTGSTATPVNDIQIWLKCGGIFDKTYTTITQVLADTTTLLALISDSNAVDYMVRSTTWASDICADQTAMTYIGANDYCAEVLIADSTWLDAIVHSPYNESVLRVKVPTMTSATTPRGVVSDGPGTPVAGGDPYHAFDGDNTTMWNPGLPPRWIQYQFTEAVKIAIVKLRPFYSSNPRVKDFIVQASNDGSSWSNIYSGTFPNLTSEEERDYIFTNDNAYIYWRLKVSSTYNNTAYNVAIRKLQFMGW